MTIATLLINTAQAAKFKYNGFAAGMGGATDYARMLGVTGNDLVQGVLPYQTIADLEAGKMFFSNNLWQTYDSNKDVSFSSHAQQHASYDHWTYNDYSASAANDNFEVGAYATEWGVYRSTRNYHFSSIPFHLAVQELLYGFIPICGFKEADPPGQLALCTVVDCNTAPAMNGSNPYFALQQACKDLEDGTAVIHDPWAAFHGKAFKEDIKEGDDIIGGTFQMMHQAKQEYKNDIRILPSFGGWSLSKMYFHMHDPTIRSNFVNSAVNILKAWPFFDGIDIDWEFPGGLGADAPTSVEISKSAISTSLQQTDTMAQGCKPYLESSCGFQYPEDCPMPMYASYGKLGECYSQSLDLGVETFDVIPEGCSKDSSIKDRGQNCEGCDGNIHYNLFKEIKAKLTSVTEQRDTQYGDHNYILTTAISGAPDKINEADYGKLTNEGTLDKIFLMSYDFMGAWGHLGHQTNLFTNPQFSTDAEPAYSVHDAVQTLVDQGVLPNKIHVGVASYGRGWKLPTADSIMSSYKNQENDLTAIASLAADKEQATGHACDGTIEAGVVDYHVIYEKNNSGAMVNVWDDCALAHLTVGQGEVYTGDSVDSVHAKGAYVKKHGLGGLFTWELGQDSQAESLVNVMNEALGRTSTGAEAPYHKFSEIGSNSCHKELILKDRVSNAPIDVTVANCGEGGGVGPEPSKPSGPPQEVVNGCGMPTEPGFKMNCFNYHYQGDTQNIEFIATQEWVDWCQGLWESYSTDCKGNWPNCDWPTDCTQAINNFISNTDDSCDCGLIHG